MKNTVLSRSAAIAAATAALALAPTTAWSAPAGTTLSQHVSPAAVQPLPTPPMGYAFGAILAKLKGKALETTFLASIIPHHRAAIEMARMELERGADPQVRTHAETAIAGQQHQIDQFTRWLREWYGLTPQQAMEQAPAEVRRTMAAAEPMMMRMMAEMRQVPRGRPFDIAFVRHMIPHHSAGVIEFLEPQSRAPHAELRVAAFTGLTSQEAQIVDFRTWLSGQSGDTAPTTDAQGAMAAVPKGAPMTGDGASQSSTTPLVGVGAALATASAGIGAIALRRRSGGRA